MTRGHVIDGDTGGGKGKLRYIDGDMGRGKGKLGRRERVAWTYIHYQM